MFFTSAGPLNYAEAQVRDRARRAGALREEGELGASAIEWVIISAVLILIVGTVGGIIWSKIQDKANSLELKTPSGPGGP